MTVIAFKHLTLVGDTLGNDEGTIVGYIRKVGRTRDGWLWGGCGSASAMAPFAAWAESRQGSPPAFDGHHSDHILISPDGEVKWWTGDGWVEPMAQAFHAWGCGRELALGAMAAGADAYGAVEIACEFDTHCGGEAFGVSLTPDGEVPKTINPIIEDDPEAVGDEGLHADLSAAMAADMMRYGGEPISPVDGPERVYRAGWREKRGL